MFAAREVETELQKNKIKAEIEHAGEIRQMKKNVEAETKQLKELQSFLHDTAIRL